MKNVLTAGFMVILVLFLSSPAMADMYKWVDQDGVTHFSDKPPASEQNVDTIKTPDYPQQSVNTAPKVPAVDGQQKTSSADHKKTREKSKADVNVSPTVEIFTTSWCRYCKSAIEFLRSHGIDFKQYDVEKDPKAAARMQALGGRGGVPFAIINGKRLYGFSEQSYKKALGLQ